VAATDNTEHDQGLEQPPVARAHVGVHVANVLKAAEEVAEEIRRGAREEAAALLERAREEAANTRREAEAAGARALTEAEALGQEMIAAAKLSARAIDELTATRQARLRLQVRALETRLDEALGALRALDAELLDPAPAAEPVGPKVDREPLADAAGEEFDSALGRLLAGGDRAGPSASRGRERLRRGDLLDRARELGVGGRLQMTTEELARAVEERSGHAR
jgi:hypothetical protein